MVFKVHDTLLKFLTSDFSIINGLNCADCSSFCNEDGIPKQLPRGSSWLCSKYFPRKSSISWGDLYEFLSQNQVEDDTDAIKLALIFIVDYILLSKKDNKLVDKFLWHMVDSLDMFGSFPWGRKSFFITLDYLKKALKEKQTDNQQDIIFYELFGFLTAFQVWIYECFLSLSNNVITYRAPKSPRICNWSKAFKSNFFSLNEKSFDCQEKQRKQIGKTLKENKKAILTEDSKANKSNFKSEEELKSDSEPFCDCFWFYLFIRF
ncbi:hypothetical protein UlMin_030246 [Ulmus minor]